MIIVPARPNIPHEWDEIRNALINYQLKRGLYRIGIGPELVQNHYIIPAPHRSAGRESN